jgi:hypothetical protein
MLLIISSLNLTRNGERDKGKSLVKFWLREGKMTRKGEMESL